MSLINYVKKEEATGQIAEIYNMIEERMKIVPNVVQFYTASPDLFGKLMGLIGHYIDHPTMDREAIAYTRMLISNKENATYCVRFQSTILKSMGIPESDLELAKEDYTKVKLPEKDRALVCFVLDQMFGNLKDTKTRIEDLKALGWDEKDIFEASVMGAIQKGMVNVIKSFEVEIDF